MSSAGERLFQRQLAAATDPTGSVNLARLGDLVVGAYAESDLDRRRTEQTSKLMAAELEEVNIVLEQVGDRTPGTKSAVWHCAR